MSGHYIQRLPALDLAIKRNTPDVPEDGRYYVVAKGKILGAFRSLKTAQARYKEYIEASGFMPVPAKRVTPEELLRREDLERDIQRMVSYWADSHKHRGSGGKLRNR